ncbi:Flp family type IVb pilin [Roseibium sediminis]|uniref:Flp family type IVb pilin n=1 Tax=Roseibium sediminis TaxID=1775174 RepID=UPI00123E44D3|nr:Flp family type IVb pilin [Roseibium sediminis]
MKSMLRRLLKDEAGATAIEYALIGVAVSIAVIAAATNIGTATSNMFSMVVNTVVAAIGS